MTTQQETIKINKKITLISCPNETNKGSSHPRIFINLKEKTTCKYCNTNYAAK